MGKEKEYNEIRETYYECRNFEINNLWQKSVLLTAFIVLIFTVYSTIVQKLFDENLTIKAINLIHEICAGISLIGLIFAIVWIMMGKGSKAWYELYENAIWNIEREKKIGIPEKYAMGRAKTFSTPDENIFSNKGGKYSPSKLNIFIGQIIMFIWTIIFIIHTYNIIKNLILKIKQEQISSLDFIVPSILVISIIIIYITAILNKWASSSFLIELEE